jgi:transcription elongation GreA/GreB family factor
LIPVTWSRGEIDILAWLTWRASMSVAFVREESAEAAQEVALPERPVSVHPNLVTLSGLRALEQAVADSQEALRVAHLVEDHSERRRAVDLAAREARYFSERLASAALRPESTSGEVVAFGHRVTIVRDDCRRQTYRIVGEDEADPRAGTISYVSPLARRLIGKRAGDLIDMDGHEIQIIESS